MFMNQIAEDFIPHKRSEGSMFRNFIKNCGKIKFHSSTISPYSFEAGGLKFGMKIYLINAVKLVGQILEFFSRS